MQNYVYDKENFDIFEGMTSITSIISTIQNQTSSRKIIKILYNIDKKKSKYNELKFLEIKASELKFELIGVRHTVIDELANGKTHGGIIAICSKVKTPSMTDVNQLIDNGFYVFFIKKSLKISLAGFIMISHNIDVI